MSIREILINSQAQNDEEGVTVSVSRQALMEFVGEYDSLRAINTELTKKLLNHEGLVSRVPADCRHCDVYQVKTCIECDKAKTEQVSNRVRNCICNRIGCTRIGICVSCGECPEEHCSCYSEKHGRNDG